MKKTNKIYTQRLIPKVLTLAFLLLSFMSMAQHTFVHPGLSHKQSDLDRMRYMVNAGMDPWLTSYNNLKADSKSSYNYEVRGNSSMTTITQDGLNYGAFVSDVKAAYLNALMWSVTGDVKHAYKAVEIFNAWSNITCFTGGGTESLNTGRVIWDLLEAAEIIKSTYSGWAAVDIQNFKDMLVYPGLSHTAKPSSVTNDNGTFYWRMYQGDASRHGNQDLFGWRGVMAMGVFLDDEIMYDRALRYLKGLSHRSDDIPYQSGPPNVSATPTSTNDYFDAYSINGFKDTEEDYGYNGVLEYYIWENGQLQESSRDQDHAILGVGMYASLAEIAWNQGDDLYSFLDNRILKGYEFAMHYNVSYAYSFSDQSSPWEPTVESGEFIQRRDRTGRWFSKKINPHTESDFVKVSRGGFKSDSRPIYELAYAHYGVREGVSSDNMKWLMRARDISLNEYGQEQNGWSLDHLGWGGLTCYRLVGMAGDPCTYQNGNPVFGLHMMPGTVEAENYDFFTGDGEGRTYHDNSSSNTGGVYRTDEAVDVEPRSAGGYNVTGIESGEWVTYTIEVPDDAAYDIKINYAADSGNGKIKFVIGDVDKTGETTVPYGGDYSTGINDWKEIVLKTNVQLSVGVQTMKVLFSGTSNSFKLNNISLEKSGKLDDEFESSLDGWISATSGATAEVINGELKMTLATLSDGKKRGDMKRSQGASLHAGNYPIIAFKMQAPTSCNVIFDTSMGSFGNGANKWTGKIAEDVYYYDLTATGFGSSNTMLSTSSITNLTTFQFKVADITSGEDNYTCDWVKAFESIEELKESLPGKLKDEFTIGLDGWISVTSGATAEAINGELKMTLATLSDGKKRGDMKRSQGATLHAGYYPIVAFRMQAPVSGNIIFDTSMGSFGNGANKWTGKIGDDVYYFDLATTGFGSSNTMLSTTSVTDLSTFQFKVADITSGEDNYICDWVKTFESIDELKALLPGKLNDEFDTGLDGWVSATSGATIEATNGQLKMTLATLTNGKKRGDIKRSQGAILHAGYYPIVALKMQAPAVSNITFDTSMGSFGNGANKWTGVLDNDVYYYDLSVTGFGSSNTKLSTTSTTELSTFQFKVADITSGEDNYTCDWIKAFESVDELQFFLGLKSVSTAEIPLTLNDIDAVDKDVKCYYSSSTIHIENMSDYASVKVYDLSGVMLYQTNTKDSQICLPWNRSGIYLINIRTKKMNKTIKLSCQM